MFFLADARANFTGDWSDPTGSVIRIAPCGGDLCAQIVKVSPRAPTLVDQRNPDASLRARPLCGLVIGQGFHVSDAEHVDGGWLYDPRSGRTYHGSMSRAGEQLELRGYIGIKLFGRSETWRRAAPEQQMCKAGIK